MIRSRLRLTLLMVLAVLIGLAAGSMWLVRSHTVRFESLLLHEQNTIKAANTILFHANMIESHILQALAPGAAPIKIQDPVIIQSSDAMRSSLQLIKEKVETPVEVLALNELEALIETILGDLAPILEDGDDLKLAPSIDINHLADAFRGVGRVSQRIVALNNARIIEQRKDFAGQTFDAILYVALLTLLAFVILSIIYWQFNALTLRPLATLTDSVREVENRNFELSLPVQRDDEIGKLSEAYNDMAAELRRLYRETDEQIVDLNARNRALLTAFPHAVIVLSEEGTILQVNPEAESILASIGTPDRLPVKLAKLFERAESSGENILHDDLAKALLFRIDNRERYYLPRVFRLPPVEDMEPAWGIILSDVTRFRWLDDMKMNVLATASHEIKTPLTSIRMVLHLLLEQKTGKLSELQEQMVSSASADCERLLETLTSLLQLARLTRGSEHLDLQAIAPENVYAKLPLSLRQEAENKQIHLEVTARKDLPLVLADEPRIAQVVTNLVSNAIKFSPRGSTVSLSASKRGADFVRFSVTDHGPGVPAGSHDRLFERFYRDPNQSSKGTGLGLSISREIVDAHNGHIGFQSQKGSPTVFYFDLPLA